MPVYTGGVTYGAYNLADVRDTQWGAISVNITNSNGSALRFGRLWLEVEYEFMDPCASGASTTQLSSVHRQMMDPANRFITDDSKEEKKSDDWTEVTPPKFSPNPSQSPGSSHYSTSSSSPPPDPPTPLTSSTSLKTSRK
jgi:hypothetical protein